MIATVVNAAAIIVGGGLGLLLRGKLQARFSESIVVVLALCTGAFGITGAIASQDAMGMVLCLVLGAALGEWLRLERGMERAGEWLKRRVSREGGGGGFTEGFVNASLIFCVGSMAIMGSLQAGIQGNYAILFSKSIMDGVFSVTYAATYGVGVLFSALPVFLYQGAITLLAAWVSPYLSAAVVTEMSAVGGVLLMGLSLNMLGVMKKPIRLANLIPCMLLPAVYQPLAAWISTLL